MRFEPVKRYQCHCKHCQWDWFAKVPHPHCCARCKNSYWDTEPILKRRAEAPEVVEEAPAASRGDGR